MKRVLVTGASGFVGRQTLDKLTTLGYEVHALHSPTSSSGEVLPGVTWHALDLLDAKEVSFFMANLKPTHMLHYAWFAVPGQYLHSPMNAQWLQASIHLMNEFALHGGKRFVGAGTCFEYDGTYGYCRETLTPLSADSIYGVCKDATRRVLESLADNLGVDFAWGRIFFLYGPHEYESRLVSSVIRALLNNEPAECSAGTQIRDFMHVEDVAAGFAALLNSSVQNSVNICTGEAIKIKDVTLTIAELLDAQDLLHLGALPMRPNEPPMLIGDPSRLRDELGFTAKYDLTAGLTETINWWRARTL